MRRLFLESNPRARQHHGINIICYYLPTLLQESVELGDSIARLVTTSASGAYLFVSVLAVPLVGEFGVRAIILVSVGT